MPGIVLENALLPKPWTGPFSNYIYAEPRISIEADRLADGDPFFAKARRECGTRSVAERLFRRQHTYVRFVNEQIVDYDRMGHPIGVNRPYESMMDISREFVWNEYGKSSLQQLDCLVKIGDPSALSIYPWLDFSAQERAKSDQERRELARQSNVRHLGRLEAWLAKNPRRANACRDADKPDYYVCGGVPGALLVSLATAKIKQACFDKMTIAPQMKAQIDSLLAQAMSRMDPTSARDMMKSTSDEQSQIGAFYKSRCLP
jgi:hypothetical protein